jgi:ubiquinone/menaquinone biosynthesis C-methylase UbiE
MSVNPERERVARVYARYECDPEERAKRDPSNPGLACIQRERAAALNDLLSVEGLLPLRGKRILDVGCGTGDELARLCTVGADSDLCVGVDLLEDRVARASRVHPDLRFLCADARALPFADEEFDLVLANLLFGSILDDEIAVDAAAELARVMSPDGAIVWYENRYPTPWNRDVRGYGLHDVTRLFPGWRIRARKVTLLPPLARRLRRAATWAYPALAAMPVLCGRYLAVLRPGNARLPRQALDRDQSPARFEV